MLGFTASCFTADTSMGVIVSVTQICIGVIPGTAAIKTLGLVVVTALMTGTCCIAIGALIRKAFCTPSSVTSRTRILTATSVTVFKVSFGIFVTLSAGSVGVVKNCPIGGSGAILDGIMPKTATPTGLLRINHDPTRAKWPSTYAATAGSRLKVTPQLPSIKVITAGIPPTAI